MSRSIYVVVVFWGAEHRSHFATMLLPSLLAPGNLDAIKDIANSKLVLCTTRDDWDALQLLPAFVAAKNLIEPLHIEIEFPAPGTNKYLHNSAGFKRAIDLCWRDGVYASLLSPDVVLSAGAYVYLRKCAAEGYEAVLAPALRFNAELCLKALKTFETLCSDRPLNVPARRLAAIAAAGLHSEILRFEFEAASFCRQPISVWWNLAKGDGLLVHTTSWAMVLVNFGALANLRHESLDHTTLDAVFILENFFALREEGRLHLVSDSDDMLLLPLTAESEMSFRPLRPLLLNRLPWLGTVIKFWNLQIFMTGPTFDPFRRWAVTVPNFIHAAPLSGVDQRQSFQTAALLKSATARPGRLLRLYAALPQWPVLLTIAALLIQHPGEFCIKTWRRLAGRRRLSTEKTQSSNR